jgi:hypothetical protein
MTPRFDRRSEPALLARIARTLFTHDTAGNLVDVNEPGGERAPRFYLAWNRCGVLWRVRHDVPPAVAERLAAIVAEQSASDDLEHPPACAAPLCVALAAHAPVAAGHAGGIEYVFPDPLDTPGDTVALTADRSDVLERWLPQWQSYATTGLPVVVALVDGAAVSVCACVRFPGDTTEAGVETHPAFRGRRHAASVTAAWAHAVRARGIFPLYGTSWHNRASQRVAAQLGLIRVAGSLSIA